MGETGLAPAAVAVANVNAGGKVGIATANSGSADLSVLNGYGNAGSGILAAKTAQACVVTVAMEGMSFLHPVRVGDTVACYAWVERIGRTSMTIPVEVWVTRYMTGEQVRVTHGVFTYVAVDDAGKPIPVKREPT